MISFEDSSEERPLKLYSKKIDISHGVPEKIDGLLNGYPRIKKCL